MAVNKNTIFLSEADRFYSPRACGILVKPNGNRCNMQCRYCYYLDNTEHTRHAAGENMPDKVLDKLFLDLILHSDIEYLSFCWHGGEPLLSGRAFFEKMIGIQEKYLGMAGQQKKRITHSLQTNGTLIDQAWARFFKENNFLIGISLDGPAPLHDEFRKTGGGKSLFNETIRGLERLKEEGVAFNTLTTVNSRSCTSGREIYDFLTSAGSCYLQFLPVVQGRGDTTVSTGDYGRFMCDVFDRWWSGGDAGRIFVQWFDVTLANFTGHKGGLCQFETICGDNPAIESNGDFYSCDHFVGKLPPAGNILSTGFTGLLCSAGHRNFAVDKRRTLPAECLKCEFLPLCRGGCRTHRLVQKGADFARNVLCEDYKIFYRHVEPYMRYMADNLR